MKKTIRNRALSLALVLALLLGMVPVFSAAEGDTYTSTVPQPQNIQLIRGSDLMIEPNEGIYLFPTGDSTQTTVQLTMKSQGN